MNNEFSKETQINDLEKQLDKFKFISKTTKEYLFVLEREITDKNNQIIYLKDTIENKNKEIKSIKNKNKKLKRENEKIKTSRSWKITSPLRKIKNIIRK